MKAKRKPGRLMRHRPPTRGTMLAPQPTQLRAMKSKYWSAVAPSVGECLGVAVALDAVEDAFAASWAKVGGHVFDRDAFGGGDISGVMHKGSGTAAWALHNDGSGMRLKGIAKALYHPGGQGGPTQLCEWPYRPFQWAEGASPAGAKAGFF